MYELLYYGGIMKTTLNIPEDLIKTAMSLSKISTKTETVVVALREYIRKKKVEKILGQEGKLEFDDTWEKSRHAR
jgi:Arc/MetJ family transcription regulator